MACVCQELCTNYFKRYDGLAEWPNLDNTPSHYGNVTQSDWGKFMQDATPRRNALTWTDSGSETGWMYGGETIRPDRPYLSDLWRIDMSPLKPFVQPSFNNQVPIEDGVPSKHFAHGPFPEMATVTSPAVPGVSDGFKMTGRAHAMLWIRDRSMASERATNGPQGMMPPPVVESDPKADHPLPVIYGGVGSHLDMPWNDPGSESYGYFFPITGKPISTDPWTTMYETDVWTFDVPLKLGPHIPGAHPPAGSKITWAPGVGPIVQRKPAPTNLNSSTDIVAGDEGRHGVDIYLKNQSLSLDTGVVDISIEG